MAWPKRKRLLLAPFLLGLALLAALCALAALDRQDVLGLRPAGVPVVYVAMALVGVLLAWGLWRLARPWWLRLLVGAGGAALAWGAVQVAGAAL